MNPVSELNLYGPYGARTHGSWRGCPCGSTSRRDLYRSRYRNALARDAPTSVSTPRDSGQAHPPAETVVRSPPALAKATRPERRPMRLPLTRYGLSTARPALPYSAEFRAAATFQWTPRCARGSLRGDGRGAWPVLPCLCFQYFEERSGDRRPVLARERGELAYHRGLQATDGGFE